MPDQYPGINSGIFKRYLRFGNTTLIFTAVDCALFNGLNVRTDQVIFIRIGCKIYENEDKAWTVIAEKCEKEYNNSIHSSTLKPNYLMTGTDCTIFSEEERNRKKFGRKLIAFQTFKNSSTK